MHVKPSIRALSVGQMRTCTYVCIYVRLYICPFHSLTHSVFVLPFRFHSLVLVLNRNFRWLTRLSSSSSSKPMNKNGNTNNKSKKKRKKRCAEAVQRGPGEADVTDINPYVTHMLFASLGIKLADNFRRVLMYTKAHQTHKSFYALLRGIFPIHELCGTMTALELAKRDVLGVNVPTWRMLLPAVFIHGMANFRGKKVRRQNTPGLAYTWSVPLSRSLSLSLSLCLYLCVRCLCDVCWLVDAS